MKFLHIADVHLGIKRYGIEERTTDFFHAWRDVIERYAICERVDFVLLAGDLFDRRQVDPQAANHAMYGLRKLKEAGIPVLAIEGNHDQRETGSRFSWLRSLSSWGFIKMLEPDYESATEVFAPWNEEKLKGWYIDIGDARIFGSMWYGTTTGNVLPDLCEQLARAHRPGAFNIMMLHTEVEGQTGRPIPGLPVSKLVTLKEHVNYLALGHIHKNFVVDDWAYNPGSLEACSIDEYQEVRGAYLVEVRDGHAEAKLIRDYFQRPFQRIALDVTSYKDPEEVANHILGKMRSQVRLSNEDEPAPIVEVTLTGRLGFKSSLLELDAIKEKATERFNLLGVLFRNETVPLEFAVAANVSNMDRAERERRVIEEIIAQDSRFRHMASELARLALLAKHLALEEEAPEKILNLIEQRLFESSTTMSESTSG